MIPNCELRTNMFICTQNLQLNDPTLPAPGELASGGANNSNNSNDNTSSPQPFSLSSPLLVGRDPYHNRAPSLGELHQELEAEQEAQVVCQPSLSIRFTVHT